MQEGTAVFSVSYTFPQYGVRYNAVNDRFDAIDPNSTDNDIAGIKNWFNEFFAKDTSRKIRAVGKAKSECGERLTTNIPMAASVPLTTPKTGWLMKKRRRLRNRKTLKLRSRVCNGNSMNRSGRQRISSSLFSR